MQRESDASLLEVLFTEQVSNFSYLFALLIFFSLLVFQAGWRKVTRPFLLVWYLMNGKSYRSPLLPLLKYVVLFHARAVLLQTDFVVVFLWQKRCFVSVTG